jgi:MoxR-like ATPase
MALQTCAVCGGEFQHDKVGRPPSRCPEHQGVKVERAPRTDTTPRIPMQSRGVSDDSVLQALRDAIQGLAGNVIGEPRIRDIVIDVVDGCNYDGVIRNVENRLGNAMESLRADMVEIAKNSGGPKTVTIDWSYDGTKAVELPDNSHEALADVVQVIDVGEHVFLVGPAGSGKSYIAGQVAKILGMPFASMSVGPNTSNSKLFGFINGAGSYVTTPFRETYENGGMFLLDEMDNGHAGLLTELNQMLAGDTCAFADKMVDKHPTFRMIATGNTFGRGANRQFVGRNVLDAATLDRFATIEVPVDERLEKALALAYAGDEPTMIDLVSTWVKYVQAVRARADELKINVIVSPRASIAGAKLLRSGMDWKRIAEIRLWAGIADDVRAKLEAVTS